MVLDRGAHRARDLEEHFLDQPEPTDLAGAGRHPRDGGNNRSGNNDRWGGIGDDNGGLMVSVGEGQGDGEMCMRGADWTSIAFRFFPLTLASMPCSQLNLSSMYTRSQPSTYLFLYLQGLGGGLSGASHGRWRLHGTGLALVVGGFAPVWRFREMGMLSGVA